MSQISDSISISCTKDGVSFASTGDLGSGRVTLKQNTSVDKEDEQVCSVCACVGVCVCVLVCVCVCWCVWGCVCVGVCVWVGGWVWVIEYCMVQHTDVACLCTPGTKHMHMVNVHARVCTP